MLDDKKNNDVEYKKIIKPYLNQRVASLRDIPHHDTNRFDHCVKVSYKSYKLCRMLGLNYESAAKAGLLHDLYFDRICECNTKKEKFKLFSNEHPKRALENAKEMFDITPLEENIILSHMWPTSIYVPKYKESFVVGLVDKIVSFSEVGKKGIEKASYGLNMAFLFIITFLFF